jgi:hypothetical protein
MFEHSPNHIAVRGFGSDCRLGSAHQYLGARQNGASWVQEDKNEHPHGASQIYQPDNNGVVYMAGAPSAVGWGVSKRQ